MLVLLFIHDEETLYADGKKYTATCKVRNELNKWRKLDQIIETFPLSGQRKPYQPRKFPTGAWEVKPPTFTDDPEYAPVKIPTTAVRNILTWETSGNKYVCQEDSVQKDSYYHLHYCKGSSTTLGCIRLDSSEDAIEIARLVSSYQSRGENVYIEVIASRR